MNLVAVTANLACGGPGREKHLSAADAWADHIASTTVDLLFLQEIPSREWLVRFEGHGFTGYTPGPEVRSFRCRSAVVVRDRALSHRPLAIPTADYHGSYVAGARIDLGGIGSVACISVHASPSELRLEDTRRWRGPAPVARVGGGRHRGELWDADYVLETLRRQQPLGPLLAAGDFNESRRWDETHRGETWGNEYFSAVANAHLVDCLDRQWGREIATRGGHQLDHVLADETVAAHVTSARVLDHMLDGSHVPSDHHPIEFVIEVSGLNT